MSTQIKLSPNLTRFAAPESTVLHHPTADLDVSWSSQIRKVGTHYSRHRSTPSARVAVRIEGSQDRAYRGQVASTINSQPSRPSTERSLIDTVGDTTLRLHS
jgi:hypothetical protein